MDHRYKCKMQTINPLEGSIGENLGIFRFSNDFLYTPQGYHPSKIDKVDIIKIEKLLLCKIYFHRIKWQDTD